MRKSRTALDGEPAGVLALLEDKPLTAADLAAVPREAPVAWALRLEPAQVLDTISRILGQLDPDAAAQFSERLKQTEAGLGIDIREGLLQPLGDVWSVYASPREGGLLSGWMATVTVRDAERLKETQEQWVAQAQRAAEQQPDAPRVQQMEVGEHTVYYVTFPGAMAPFAPAWAVTETHVVFGQSPQVVRGHLRQKELPPSVVEIPEVAALLQEGPLGLSYVDEKAVFQAVYPFVKMIAQNAIVQAQRQGMDVDITLLPAASTVEGHLGAATSAFWQTEAGFEGVSRTTWPDSSIAATGPVAVALLLPAVTSARRAARRMQSSNNLKQMALALHNYHDTFRGFPAAYNTDKEGKPLLSWRVQILPYVEQQALYERFRLDEPWDSEHNRQLIPLIPEIYRAPGTQSDPGKTNYLAIRSERSVLVPPKQEDYGKPKPEGMGMQHIIDGTANTVVVVEVSDENAATWTKPDDFEHDEDDPLQGLVGLRSGGFLAMLADGSVRFITEAIDKEVLNLLFQRNSGRPVPPF